MARMMQTHRQSSSEGRAHGNFIRFFLRMSRKFSIGKRPFQRMVRKVAKDIKVGIRFQKRAMLALHVATEEYFEEIFYRSDLSAVKAKRITIMLKDFQSAKRICDECA